MKELKFRALDTITNIMHNSIEGLCFENGILIEVIFKKSWEGTGSCSEEIVDWQDADKTILMQYTGNKDHNDVEIFEGDFLKSQKGILWLVSQHEDGTWVASKLPSGLEYFSLEDLNPIRMKIIGNNYENPEIIRKYKP